MPIDQVLLGSIVTGALAIASQIVSKCRCYVAVEKTDAGEICRPTIQCGFSERPLPALRESDDEDTIDK
jgi:hypothetical protein